MKNEIHKKYGLFTSMTMIIGIVIGSGIFFKTDDILINTNGNIIMGVICLIVGAIGIIFGGLSLSELAKLDDRAGGIITYAEFAVNKFFAFLIGFFQGVCYFPALIAIISYICANYLLLLFPTSPINIWVLSFILLIFLFSINYLSAKLSGYFQNIATIIKLIPLIGIGIAGLFISDTTILLNNNVSLPLFIGSSSAIVSVAFSYDGWTIAPSICHEIKNAKRNLPLALSISPIIIMLVYLIYFIGMNFILTPATIIELQDAHVYVAANQLLGSVGSKIIMVTIIISVLGTLDGLIMGSIQVPYAMALRNELPYSEKLSNVSTKYDMPFYSTIIVLIFSLLWLFFHYLSCIIPALSHIDISGIPIVLMYIFYITIFLSIIKLYFKKKTDNFFRSVICSILATLGSFIVIYGALSSQMGMIYIIISFIILFIGAIMFWYKKRRNKEVDL